MPAPDLIVAEWMNTNTPLALPGLRGRVVAIEAFQMLCPACVSDGLPQALSIARHFPASQVQVIGLHSVFEHHAAMSPVALRAFLHEYRITFPVAVDAPGDGPIPRTMELYGLHGTPSLLLIDRAGRLRAHHFGVLPDLAVGAAVAALVAEPAGCDDEICVVPSLPGDPSVAAGSRATPRRSR